MAAVSLFWDTNMAAVTSCENTLYIVWAKEDESRISHGEEGGYLSNSTGFIIVI